MDPKKKKLYTIIIVCCIVIAVGVMLWGRGGTPTLQLPATSQSATGTSVKVSNDGTYTTPTVFPATTQIDSSVLDSTLFKTLKTYTPAAADKSVLGRDNPFNNY